MDNTETRSMLDERRKGVSYADLSRKYGIGKDEARVICETASDSPPELIPASDVKCPCGALYLRVEGGYVPTCTCAATNAVTIP